MDRATGRYGDGFRQDAREHKEGLRLPPPHSASTSLIRLPPLSSPRTLPPPSPSIANEMVPSRSNQPSEWTRPAPWPATARAGWSFNPRQSSEGSFGAILPPLMHHQHREPDSFRPHTSYYAMQHPSAPTPPRPQTSAKHSTDEDSSGKKKKRRIALACAECAKRKQRCNREVPCQHCISRRVPELCRPYTRSGTPPPRGVKLEPVADRKTLAREPSDRPTLPTLSVRMARVEDLLNVMVNKVPGLEGQALDLWRINHPPALSPEAEDDEDDSETEEPLSVGKPSIPGDVEEGTEATQEPDVGRLDVDTGFRNPLPQSMIRSTQPVLQELDSHGPPAEQLQRLFFGCGVQPQKVRDLVNDLPLYPLASKLVDWFFLKINFVRYPIDEQMFRQSFEAVYANGEINHTTVLALPLVLILLAISMRVAPDNVAGLEGVRKTSSLKLYWDSKAAICIASAVKTEHLQLVETHILTGLYLVLMHDRRLAEGWAQFRAGLTTGFAIGLHRDGAKLGLDPVMTEYRRRLWSYLLHADATYSCLLGRPTAIDPSCVDTLPPSNINMDDLRRDAACKPNSLEQPTYGTYLLLRYKLGVIVARVALDFQKLQGNPAYRDVEDLDAEFQALIDDLPLSFRMENPDRRWDNQLWYLPVHRYYIQTEILHFRIILHRPWLLRKISSNRYSLSRRVTLEAAVQDHKIREAFKRDVPDFFETLLGGSFRSFNAAMIAGISLIINPTTPYASDMKAIVRLFMEQHPHDPKADDFTQQEATIIATLQRRALEYEARRAQASQRQVHSTSSERSRLVPSPPKGRNEILNSSQEAALPDVSSWQAGVTRSNMHSPDDDRSQQLFNNWLMAHPQVGPGADATMTPFGVVPSQLQPYAQPLNGDQPHSAVGDGRQSYDGTAESWADTTSRGGANLPSIPLGPFSDKGQDIGGQTMLYWETLIDGMIPENVELYT